MMRVMTETEHAATQQALEDLQRLHVSLLIQIDQLDREVRRLRWWVLAHALLLLTLAVIVLEARP